MAAVSWKKDRKKGHVVSRYVLKTKTIKKNYTKAVLDEKLSA